MKSNSDRKPQAIMPLGDGTYHFNYNVKKTFVEVEGSDKKRANYDYDTLHVTDASYASIVAAMIAERYSVADELALHRQKDVKVAEFTEYSSYCEECKAIVRPFFE